MEDFSKADEIDTFKDFIRVDKAEMTLLGSPVLKGSAQDAAIKHKINEHVYSHKAVIVTIKY